MRTNTIRITVVTALLAALVACGPDLAPARVVRIDSGAADTAKMLSFPFFWAGQVPGALPAAWLGPGTFLYDENSDGSFYPYLRTDGEHVSVSFTEWSVLLSGHVVSLNLDENGAAWLERASETDLAGLRIVYVPDSLPPTLRPALLRLAAANPHVGLSFGSAAAMELTLPLFQTRLLFLGDSVGLASGQLARQRQLETLYWMASDSGSLPEFRGLPKLRQLVVFGDGVRLTGQLPAGLEALTLAVGEEIDANRLDNLPRLRTLVLSGSKWRGVSDLASLKKLRWLGLPTNATQAEFAAIVRAHPNLEVIELIGVDSVTDLSPLRGPRRLRALTLSGEYADLGVLRELASLEFVGLEDDIWKKSPEQVAAIQAALPAAVVVRVKQFCLGSGWILLLVPAAILGVLARPRPRSA